MRAPAELLFQRLITFAQASAFAFQRDGVIDFTDDGSGATFANVASQLTLASP